MKKLIALATIVAVFATTLCGCSSTGVPINDDIGPLVKIDVYVNNMKVDTPVYQDINAPPISGPYNLSDYVFLKPVCEVMGATFAINDDSIILNYKDEEYKIEETFFERKNYWILDGIVYARFSAIRFAMDGSGLVPISSSLPKCGLCGKLVDTSIA